MIEIDLILFASALAFYCATTAVLSFGMVFQRERPWQWGQWLMYAGFVLHSSSLAMRWVVTGHIPTIGNYENTNMAAWFIVLFTSLFTMKTPQFRAANLFSLPIAIIIMGFGLLSDRSQSPMVASLQTGWLYVHIFFAWLVTGALSFATGASVLYLIKERRSRSGGLTPFYERLPSLERISDLIYRNVVYGFIAYAAMIAAGALWAKDLWGAYWSWDPVETWSLVSWMIYGFILHIRFTFKISDKLMSWLVIFALITVIIAMFGINFMVETSMHIFSVNPQ